MPSDIVGGFSKLPLTLIISPQDQGLLLGGEQRQVPGRRREHPHIQPQTEDRLKIQAPEFQQPLNLNPGLGGTFAR